MKKWAALVLTVVMLLCAASALAVELTGDNLVVTIEPKTAYWNGSEQKPTVNVQYKDGDELISMTENVDYNLVWKLGTKKSAEAASSLTDIDKYYVEITGTGAYSERVCLSDWMYTISKLSLKNDDVQFVLDQDSYVYNGTAREPALLKIVFNGAELPSDVYTISYENNKDETSKAKVVIKSDGIHCSGTKTLYFKIREASLKDDAEITLDPDGFVYDGTEKKPGVTVMVDGAKMTEGVDYKVTYKYNTNVPSATATKRPKVTITGLNSCKDSVEKEFTIEPASIAGAQITLEQDVYPYTGSRIEPEVTSVYLSGEKLEVRDDYTVSYDNNKDAGEATVKITGVHNYTGEATTSFTIGKLSISDGVVSLVDVPETGIAYDGETHKPKVQIEMPNGKVLTSGYFTLTYQQNGNTVSKPKEPGVYTILIAVREKYSKNYDGENQITFEIRHGITAEFGAENAFTYTGKEQKPTLTVKSDDKILVKDMDYSVTYVMDGKDVTSPTEAGTYTMKVAAKKDSAYTGSAETTFTITKRDLKDVKVILENASMGYTGSAIKPVVKAFDLDGNMLSVSDDDYTLEYIKDGAAVDEPKEAGVYTVRVNASETSANYTGEQTAAFEIERSTMNIVPDGSEGTEQLRSDYTYGEDICVTVKAQPSGAAPMRMMMRGPRPAQPKQMALYVKEGDGFKQISDGVDANADGEYELVYDSISKRLLPGMHTLYAGYTGDSNTLDTMKELGEVTIHRKKLTAFASAQSRPYSPGHTQVEILKVTLTGVEQGDDVYAVTNTGDVGSEQMGGYTKLTALPLEGQKLLQGKDAIWYSLSAAMDTVVEILPADMDSLPKTGDASMLGAWIALLGAAGMGLKLRRKQ